jgi:hypothetical protein
MTVNSKKEFFHAKILIIGQRDSSLVVFAIKLRNWLDYMTLEEGFP